MNWLQIPELAHDPFTNVMLQHLFPALCIIALLGISALIAEQKEKRHYAFFEGKKYYSDN